MSNPYAQVALTYLSHPFGSVLRCIIAIYVLLMLGTNFAVMGRCGSQQNLNLMHLLSFAALFLYWTVHVKEQFADCRATLTPGFRRVHITVAAALAIVFAVLLPAAIAPLMGWQSFGFVALTTLTFGAVVWFIVFQTGWLCWLILAGFLSILAEPVKGGLDELVHGHFEAQAYAVFAIGAAISLWGGIRLALLNEEMPEYHVRFRMDWSRRIQMTDQQQQAFDKALSRGLKGWLTERRMERMIHHARHASESWWSRVCRWRVTYFTSIPLVGLFLYIYFLLLIWMMGKDIPIMAFALIVSFVPICVVWGTLGFWKTRSLARELMLPVSREAFLRQQGTSAVIGQFQMLIAVIAAFTLCMLTVPKESHPLLLGYAIAFSALSQIWQFGVVVWIMRYRSVALNILGIVVAMYSTMIPMIVLEGPTELQQWQPLLLPIGVLYAIFGLLLTWRAYRRWLVTDLD